MHLSYNTASPTGSAGTFVKHRLPLAVYVTVYAASLVVMYSAGFAVAEPLVVLFLFGLALSLLAWWSTRGASPCVIAVRHPEPETAVLGVYMLVVVAFLTWGLPGVRLLSARPLAQALLVTVAKLLVCVLVPFMLWRRLWHYDLAQFVNLPEGLRGHWRAAVVMSAALLILQAVVGRAPGDLAELRPRPAELVLALPLASAWLFVEVGIVEEFLFRGLLQARLAAATRSELTGMVLMALIFGLAHAPGLYLRPAATGEALGPHPTLLVAIGYSIVMISVTGIFLGILWMRTRNLVLLALIHTAGDLLPNLAETIRLLRLTF